MVSSLFTAAPLLCSSNLLESFAIRLSSSEPEIPEDLKEPKCS
jgi:hypothetical protein